MNMNSWKNWCGIVKLCHAPGMSILHWHRLDSINDVLSLGMVFWNWLSIILTILVRKVSFAYLFQIRWYARLDHIKDPNKNIYISTYIYIYTYLFCRAQIGPMEMGVKTEEHPFCNIMGLPCLATSSLVKDEGTLATILQLAMPMVW